MSLRILELFSASGALAYGFRQAGLEVTMAFDHDADACASYEANLGIKPVQMEVHDLIRMVRAGWSAGALDLIVADPPCAPWSRAGKREGLADERDMLETTVELVVLLRPRAYLIGNIPGLEDGPHLPVVQRLIGGLAKQGYCVRDFAVLDAADYGVPQRRLRPFWYGHRAGRCIQWPARTHCDPRELRQSTIPGVEPLKPWVTCRQALRHLPAEQIGRPVRLKHEGKRAAPRHPPSDMDAPARTVVAGDGGGSRKALRAQALMGQRVGDMEKPAATLPAKASRVGAGAALVFDLSPTAWPWDKPATTVCADQRFAPPGTHVANFLSAPDARGQRGRTPQSARVGAPDEPAKTIDARPARAGTGDNGTLAWPWERPATTLDTRDTMAPAGRNGRSEERGGEPQPQRGNPDAIVLSEAAAMVLQGLPQGWKLVGATKKARWSQLGQAVPPPVAAAIARCIVKALAPAKESAA